MKDLQDTSNHLQKNKVYEENETLNPFFNKNTSNDVNISSFSFGYIYYIGEKG